MKEHEKLCPKMVLDISVCGHLSLWKDVWCLVTEWPERLKLRTMKAAFSWQNFDCYKVNMVIGELETTPDEDYQNYFLIHLEPLTDR